MKKKIVSALLCTGMLAGCGNTDANGTNGTQQAATGNTEKVSASDDGKVLNIYCWNEEFKSRITDHYPDYKEVDATHGKIGDVEVVWNIHQVMTMHIRTIWIQHC